MNALSDLLPPVAVMLVGLLAFRRVPKADDDQAAPARLRADVATVSALSAVVGAIYLSIFWSGYFEAWNCPDGIQAPGLCASGISTGVGGWILFVLPAFVVLALLAPYMPWSNAKRTRSQEQ